MDPNQNKFPNSQNDSPSQDYYPNLDHIQLSEEFMQFDTHIPQYHQSTKTIPQSSSKKAQQTRTNPSPGPQIWTDQEDMALMSSWCIVSENKIIGKNQKSDALWQRVLDLYEEARENNPLLGEERSAESLRNRFKRISSNVTKWIGVYKDVIIHAATMSLQPTNHTTRAARRFIDRRPERGHESLVQQYFSDDPIYPPDVFRKRFRMQKSLFERIMNKIVANDEYFQQRRNATGRLGMSSLQKCTAAMRVLAYGTGADLHDEYLRMSAATIRKSVTRFVEGVIANFGDEYLRKPTDADIANLLHIGEERGFPGMLGSIDCMHWVWKNCPSAWAGQYAGRSGKPTIILEAVASQDLWIWHAFFGSPGTRNDINVLEQSPIFNDVLEGRAPKVNYIVNGHEYNMGYYLTDGIYPQWSAFVKSINCPQIRKHKLFAQHQEAARKDVERAFGVLQARFAFIKQPCLIWDRDMMGKIMIACIIMHNMIVEDERATYLNYRDPVEFIEPQPPLNNRESEDEEDNGAPNFDFSTERIASLASYMTNRSQLRNREAHNALKNDLIEHIWQKFGASN